MLEEIAYLLGLLLLFAAAGAAIAGWGGNRPFRRR